ncbi:MAG: hypothetical protein HQ582_27760, partial [Planctomycetes bacterium]|nr:hypothetical protein [Planctomycetota bacterium]
MGPQEPAPMSMARLAVFTAAVLAILVFPLLAETPIERTWNEEHAELLEQIGRMKESDAKWRDRLAAEALDPQALILPTDKDPLDVVLRRTGALVQHFKSRKMLSESVLSGFETQWHELSTAAQSTSGADARRNLYIQACRLRRAVALANPRLDFDHIVCMLEQPGDGRMMEQARAVYPGHNKGGGPIIIRNFTSEPVRAELLAGVRVTSGPWQGKELTGKFSGLELNYNGKELLFAATTDAEVWHVFRFNLVTRRLEQLTDGPHDDFDPHQLPSGRIVFTSTRRGGA